MYKLELKMLSAKVVPYYSSNNIMNLMSLKNRYEDTNHGSIIPSNRFEIIFRKIVFSLRLLGIPLDPSAIKKKSRILYYWSIGLGLLSIFLNVTLTFYSFSRKENPKTTGQINLLINEINISFTMLLIHAGLFFVTSLRWSNLSSMIIRIEKLGFFQPEDYEKFRKISLVGSIFVLVMIVLSVVGGVFFMLDPLWPGGFILSIRITVFSCYVNVGLFLCFIVSITIAKMLTILNQKTKHTIGDKRRLTLKLVSQWQRCYYLIDGLIREMNLSLGFIFTMLVLFNLIWLVNGSFFTLLEWKELGYLNVNHMIGNSLLIITTTIITFLISVLHGFKQKALSFVYELRSLDTENYALHRKVHDLIMEVSQSLPQVTMLGMVDADLRIVPTLIGTTLTYIIILLQF